MRKYAILLSLTMVACSFAGCLGGEDASPVGDWYMGENMVIEFKEDGSAVTGDETGTWSTDGDSLTVTIEEADVFKFVILGDWLWLKDIAEGECAAFAPDAVPDSEWQAAAEGQTPPEGWDCED